MIRRWSGLLALAWLAVATPVPAASVPARAARYDGADELARRIDRHLESGWKKARVVPAPQADEGEWVRRIYLDLAGRIPSVAEVRAFLADRRPDRRTRLVEQLLDGQRFNTHYATLWRALLLPEASSNFQVRFQVGTFEGWLRDWLASGKGYDVMARELLTAPVDGRAGRALVFGAGGGTSPAPFYAAKEYKPEEIAAATARLFLGVNLGCAQCHHHPFASWKREQFWSFAAFFSGIDTQRNGDFVVARGEKVDRHELTIPGTEKKVKARYLDGKQPEIKPGTRARQSLAEWVTARDNPYFARAAVNRVWAQLFGTGLIEPLDEMAGSDHPASHPELLDDLARAFAAHDFDLRWLIRAVTATRAYQQTSVRTHPSQDDPRQFARAALRGLTPEQLFDSLAMATGYQEGGGGPRRAFFAAGGARNEFLSKFNSVSEKTTEVQTSILQALTLMNGRVMNAVTGLKSSETLAAVADAPFLDTRDKIETLFLSALSRRPTDRELSRMVAHVEKGGDRGEALADVFWALLNSAEFLLNH